VKQLTYFGVKDIEWIFATSESKALIVYVVPGVVSSAANICVLG